MWCGLPTWAASRTLTRKNPRPQISWSWLLCALKSVKSSTNLWGNLVIRTMWWHEKFKERQAAQSQNPGRGWQSSAFLRLGTTSRLMRKTDEKFVTGQPGWTRLRYPLLKAQMRSPVWLQMLVSESPPNGRVSNMRLLWTRQARLLGPSETCLAYSGWVLDKSLTCLDFKLKMHLFKSNPFYLKLLNLHVHWYIYKYTQTLIV